MKQQVRPVAWVLWKKIRSIIRRFGAHWWDDDYVNKNEAYRWQRVGYRPFVGFRLPDQNNLHFALHDRSLHDPKILNLRIEIIGLEVTLRLLGNAVDRVSYQQGRIQYNMISNQNRKCLPGGCPEKIASKSVEMKSTIRSTRRYPVDCAAFLTRYFLLQ